MNTEKSEDKIIEFYKREIKRMVDAIGDKKPLLNIYYFVQYLFEKYGK